MGGWWGESQEAAAIGGGWKDDFFVFPTGMHSGNETKGGTTPLTFTEVFTMVDFSTRRGFLGALLGSASMALMPSRADARPLELRITGADYPSVMELKSMVVPDERYPDGQTRIWVPSDYERDKYANETDFVATGLPAGNVSDTRNEFGYRTSDAPPTHVPNPNLIDYSLHGAETPLYPFIGQKIPGSNLWLVDIVDGKVVPALTTIDQRLFKSINWPRERYMEAIAKARAGQQDFTLADFDNRPDVSVSGVVKLVGDYTHNNQNSFFAPPGTVFVMTAKQAIPDLEYDVNNNPGRITVHFWNLLTTLRGTPQRPIIWTSDAVTPEGNDWNYMAPGGNADFQCEYNIGEYGATIINLIHAAEGKTFKVNDCILRHTELGDNTSGGVGIGITINNSAIEHNEIHNHRHAIATKDGIINVRVNNNVVYNCTAPIGDAKGMFTGGANTQIEIENNTAVNCGWGIAPEDSTDLGTNIHHNTIVANDIGVMMYHRGTGSNPRLENNNIWGNMAPPYATNVGPDGQANYARGSEVLPEGHQVIHDYDAQNESFNPGFRNSKIYDLTQDRDQDGLSDAYEIANSHPEDPYDPDRKPLSHLNPDSDGDGLSDMEEIVRHHTDPELRDTDGDGVPDGTEIQYGYDPTNPHDTPKMPAASTLAKTALAAGLGALAAKLLLTPSNNNHDKEVAHE